jgi:hypothetical protein
MQLRHTSPDHLFALLEVDAELEQRWDIALLQGCQSLLLIVPDVGLAEFGQTGHNLETENRHDPGRHKEVDSLAVTGPTMCLKPLFPILA